MRVIKATSWSGGRGGDCFLLSCEGANGESLNMLRRVKGVAHVQSLVFNKVGVRLEDDLRGLQPADIPAAINARLR